MAFLEQIRKDMTAAMKGREEARLDAIRMIKLRCNATQSIP
jgi:uncharacterized protein YqeY